MSYDYKGSKKEDRPKKGQVPKGEHEFMIETVEETKSTKGNDMVVFTLRCMDADMEDKYWNIDYFLVLGNEWTDGNIGDMMDAMGKNRSSDTVIDWFEWRGEYLSAMVKMKKYEGEDYSKIHYFLDARATSEELKENPGVNVESLADEEPPF